MDAIAAGAGVAKGSLYNYFQSKQDLFTQLFTETISGEMANAQELLAAPTSARERLEAILDYWSGRLGEFKQIGRLVLEFWANAAREGTYGEMTAVFHKVYAGWREMLARLLAQGAEAGEFSLQYEPAVAASLIMAVLDGIQVQSILDVGLDVDDKFIAGLKRGIMIGLSAGDQGPAPGPTENDDE